MSIESVLGKTKCTLGNLEKTNLVLMTTEVAQWLELSEEMTQQPLCCEVIAFLCEVSHSHYAAMDFLTILFPPSDQSHGC